MEDMELEPDEAAAGTVADLIRWAIMLGVKASTLLLDADLSTGHQLMS